MEVLRLLLLASLVILLALPPLLTVGCDVSWSASSNNTRDCDEEEDDDDGDSGINAPPPLDGVDPDPFELSDCVVIEAKAGHRHPIAAVVEIRGLFLEATATERGADRELVDFTAKVLEANAWLLLDGHLLLGEPQVRHVRGQEIVEYRQCAVLADGSRLPVFGSSMRFVFDEANSLTRIDNQTFVSVDGLAPPALSSANIAALAYNALPFIAMPAADPENKAWNAAARQLPFYADHTEVLRHGLLASRSAFARVVYEVRISGSVDGRPVSLKVLMNGNNGGVIGSRLDPHGLGPEVSFQNPH
jgi:hypothetical protein